MTGRYTLLCAALTSVVFPAMAQIPNAGFEQWQDQGGYTEPAGWITYNDVMTPQGYFTTVEPGSPGAEGSHYALVQSRMQPSGGIIQGWMSAAPNGHGQPAGFACTERPAALTGQWQYGIQSNDTAEVMVALVQTNGTGQITEIIAEGALEATGSQGEWTAFSVPLTYYSDDVPDQAGIQFMASKSFGSPAAGSFLKVDALSFTGQVGIPEQATVPALRLYPSPAADVIDLEGGARMTHVSIMDLSGRTILENGLNTDRTRLNVAELQAGQYVVQVRWADGTQSMHGFTKE